MKFLLRGIFVVLAIFISVSLFAANNKDFSQLFDQPNDDIKAYVLQSVELINICSSPCRLTLLDHAIIKDNYEIAEFLLHNGANPNTFTVASETSLHLAAELGKAEMVALLLKFGADPNARSNINSTPLAKVVRSYSCIDAGKLAAIKLLLPLTKIDATDLQAMERCFKNLRRGGNSQANINKAWQEFVAEIGLGVR